VLRVVLDTNVVVSAVLSERGPPARLLDLVLAGELRAVSEPRILAEYRQVLARPKFELGMTYVSTLLEVLEAVALSVAAPPWPGKLPDPDDEVFLATAWYAQAMLVTGNIKHYPPESRRDARVATPRQFWDLFAQAFGQ
jgi:putative PIN family toxin of toxin-antitoxin system